MRTSNPGGYFLADKTLSAVVKSESTIRLRADQESSLTDTTSGVNACRGEVGQRVSLSSVRKRVHKMQRVERRNLAK